MKDREKLKNKISVIIVMNRFDNNVISEEIAEKILKVVEEDNQPVRLTGLYGNITEEELLKGLGAMLQTKEER